MTKEVYIYYGKRKENRLEVLQQEYVDCFYEFLEAQDNSFFKPFMDFIETYFTLRYEVLVEVINEFLEKNKLENEFYDFAEDFFEEDIKEEKEKERRELEEDGEARYQELLWEIKNGR